MALYEERAAGGRLGGWAPSVPDTESIAEYRRRMHVMPVLVIAPLFLARRFVIGNNVVPDAATRRTFVGGGSNP
jgi:hypothetical protein